MSIISGTNFNADELRTALQELAIGIATYSDDSDQDLDAIAAIGTIELTAATDQLVLVFANFTWGQGASGTYGSGEFQWYIDSSPYGNKYTLESTSGSGSAGQHYSSTMICHALGTGSAQTFELKAAKKADSIIVSDIWMRAEVMKAR